MNNQRQDTTAGSEAAELFTVVMLGLRGLIAGQYPRNHKYADVYAWMAEGGHRAGIRPSTGTQPTALTSSSRISRSISC